MGERLPAVEEPIQGALDRVFLEATGEEEASRLGALAILGTELRGEGVVHALGLVGGFSDGLLDGLLGRAPCLQALAEFLVALGTSALGSRPDGGLSGAIFREQLTGSEPREGDLDVLGSMLPFESEAKLDGGTLGGLQALEGIGEGGLDLLPLRRGRGGVNHGRHLRGD